jgi:2,3-bisphosphoglycerate-independent phosphoglycerate mutase
VIALLRYIHSPPSTQDYETASDPTLSTLNESERAGLYSELASGAETGHDQAHAGLLFVV